jgi:hypothetical protein
MIVKTPHREHSPPADPAPKALSKQESARLQLEKCEDTLSDVLHELTTYSYLLRWLGPGADSGDNLYGLGVSLDRLGRQISRTMERLGKLKERSSSEATTTR